FGSDWPIVAVRVGWNGLFRRSQWDGARSKREKRPRGVDVQDECRSKVIAGGGRKQTADRVLRRTSVLSWRIKRRAHLEVSHSRAGSLHSGSSWRRGIHKGLGRAIPRDPHKRWARVVPSCVGSLHGCFSGDREWNGFLRHVRQRSDRREPANASSRLAIYKPAAAIPVLLVGGSGRGESSDRRPRQDGALPEIGYREATLDIHDASESRVITGACRWAGVYRGKRWEALFVGLQDRRHGVGVDCRCAAERISGNCSGTNRHRLGRRKVVLLRLSGVLVDRIY